MQLGSKSDKEVTDHTKCFTEGIGSPPRCDCNAADHASGMVEARGVEPLSEERRCNRSTCLSDVLILRSPTPIGRLRTTASPECFHPQPLSTGLGPACCIAPLPPPQASGGGTSQLIKLRVPVLGWQLLFSRRFYETPRARHAPLTSRSPSKPVAPLSLVAE